MITACYNGWCQVNSSSVECTFIHRICSVSWEQWTYKINYPINEEQIVLYVLGAFFDFLHIYFVFNFKCFSKTLSLNRMDFKVLTHMKDKLFNLRISFSLFLFFCSCPSHPFLYLGWLCNHFSSSETLLIIPRPFWICSSPISLDYYVEKPLKCSIILVYPGFYDRCFFLNSHYL